MVSKTIVKRKNKKKIDEPPLFKCILYNDEVTVIDFVVMILIDVFNMHETQALDFANYVQDAGKGICGVYPFGIAETKARQVENIAQLFDFPLKCEIEPE